MSMRVNELTITRPDDWHLHLRIGEALKFTVPDAARQFKRAIVMPNTKPPITTVKMAEDYLHSIIIADGIHSEKTDFEPLMTLYLTDSTTVNEARKAFESGFVHAFKLYPAGATTNSDNGVTDIRKVYKVISLMEALGMPLLVHGEVTDPKVDIFDREAVFIDRVLIPLLRDYPNLRVVMEHITTRQAAEFVASAGPNVAATITAHHMLLNRNALFQGGIRPHHYCLPVLKREVHRQALVAAATSDHPNFFLGTDSAPHAKRTKEAACGCAGCYTAHAAIELYAEVFDSVDALDKLEAFASFHGPDWYGLPRNTETITLVREDWVVPDSLPYIDGDVLIPLRAGETIAWKLAA